jgi:hypothetical protein
MESSDMRPIGFSTGALAKGDFLHGLELQRLDGVTAVELSALRDHELQPLVEAVTHLDVARFEYVSFHAPSSLKTLDEPTVFELLQRLPADWPIIVHPEILRTPALWKSLGERLCIENMDNRKSGGRTVAELRAIFETFPGATFCLDAGHARQIDPTMITAILMLREFGARLRQVHVSEVGPGGEHLPLGLLARVACSRLASAIPSACPLIIESIIAPDEIDSELAAVRDAFTSGLSIETYRSVRVA